MKLVQGYKEGSKIKIAVSMSPQLFHEVRLLAKEEGRTFTDQVGILLRAGLRELRRHEKDEECEDEKIEADDNGSTTTAQMRS